MFAQPWAWLGLAGLAVPLAIHLLARHQAVRALFPTLRFIDATELSAIRRHRLTDLPLLFVRMAIVALAVAAIAGPTFFGATVTTSGPAAIAVVVDASAGAISDAGPAAARAAVQNVPASTIVSAASLPEGIRSASAWLTRQSGRRELLVISDFQRGAIDAASLAIVPAGVGVRFAPLPFFAAKPLPGFEMIGERARMAWPVAPSNVPLPLTVRAGAEQLRADAMLSAVASLVNTSPVDATARRAAIVFRGAPDFASLRAQATPIDQPWMFAVVQPLVNDAAIQAHITPTVANGELVVLVDDVPDSVRSASIASAMLGTLLQPLPWSEFEPDTIAADQLRAWERQPSGSTSSVSGEPQGRWVWLLVLALLGVEMWMRRRVATSMPAEVRDARVA